MTTDTSPEPISAERLREILAGTEGVTDGPWEVGVAGDYGADMQNGAYFTPIHGVGWGAFASVVTAVERGDGGASTSAEGLCNLVHIARLDPQTVASMATLALEALAARASETLKAEVEKPSEGEIERAARSLCRSTWGDEQQWEHFKRYAANALRAAKGLPL